jgi:hypothetical protein
MHPSFVYSILNENCPNRQFLATKQIFVSEELLPYLNTKGKELWDDFQKKKLGMLSKIKFL